MSDPRNGDHPFPIDERPLDKDSYPSDLPSAVNPHLGVVCHKAYRGFRGIGDFALQASPRTIYMEDPQDIPWSYGLDTLTHDLSNGRALLWLGGGIKDHHNPSILHDLARRNTIRNFFYDQNDNPNKHPAQRARLDHFIDLRDEFTVLAGYSRKCNNLELATSGHGRWYKSQLPEMTDEEKTALLKIAAVLSDACVGAEYLTRFVNPTGSMGNAEYYDDTGLTWTNGINGYFSGLLQLPPMHYNYMFEHQKGSWKTMRCPSFHDHSWDRVSGEYFHEVEGERPGVAVGAKELRERFFEDTKGWYMDDAARLLGLGARQWGLDKPRSELSDQELRGKMERFYRYLFSAKGLEIMNCKGPHGLEPRGLLNEELDQILYYPEYVDTLRAKGIHILQAEEKLVKDIEHIAQNIDTLSAEHSGTKKFAVFRVLNRVLSWEKKHALEFLLSDNGEGQNVAFSR